MDLFLWVILGFIIIGFVVLASMKKNMEKRLAFIKENMKSNKSSATSIVWWIVGTVAWGIASIILIVLWFFTE